MRFLPKQDLACIWGRANVKQDCFQDLDLEFYNLLPYLREFVKTLVILTPDALLVGWEPHFVLHFRGIRGIRRIRRGVQKSCFDQ